MADKNNNRNLTIDEKLILVKEPVSGKEEIITKLGALLFDNGYVEDTFTQAVLEREIVYPTGLKARVTGVAVPHTDTEHVIRPAVAIATLKDPIIFHGMGAPDTEVEVDIVLMLAIHDPKEVVNVLRKVIFVIEDDEALQKIQSAKNKTDIKKIMRDHIQALTEKMGR
ncbi:MAG TPA: PTS sugar transporter subunit IIA [Pelolinea sp.]|nr:PTS sugar transporter subunit IIA [Pelolinea sp.]